MGGGYNFLEVFFARGANIGMIRPVFFLFLGRRSMGKYDFVCFSHIFFHLTFISRLRFFRDKSALYMLFVVWFRSLQLESRV